uniref:Uncharacterized protein n=1 Tax=Rhodnius prolixus TaxID=13249 RepID=T1IE16_RHOPR
MVTMRLYHIFWIYLVHQLVACNFSAATSNAKDLTLAYRHPGLQTVVTMVKVILFVLRKRLAGSLVADAIKLVTAPAVY